LTLFFEKILSYKDIKLIRPPFIFIQGGLSGDSSDTLIYLEYDVLGGGLPLPPDIAAAITIATNTNSTMAYCIFTNRSFVHCSILL